MNSSLHFFFSQFFFPFSFLSPYVWLERKNNEKKRGGNWWLARWFTTGCAGALFTPKTGKEKDQRVGVYVSTVIGVQSQPTKCCDDFRISSLFSPFFKQEKRRRRKETSIREWLFISSVDWTARLPPLVRFRWVIFSYFSFLMKINVRLFLAPSSCVQALAAMCEKDEQSLLLLLLFAFFILAFYPFPFGAHGETGAENRTIIPSAARLATRLASPAGFGRVVYFSLCVRALCSFGRGYNQPAEKEKKNRKKRTKETHQQEPPMYIDTQCSHICTQRDRKRDTVTW